MENLVKVAVLLIFLGCYALAVSRRVRLGYLGVASALLILCVVLPAGIMGPQEVLGTIRWDVLGIYWGFMMLSMVFADSGVPKRLAKHVIKNTKNEGAALLALCAITALLSSFLENVGVLLIMAPIAMEVARRAGSSPLTYLISIALSSNMVTTVSMVADPPAIILASETGMSFLDFYWFRGRVGLGVISAVGAAAGLAALYLAVFRRMKRKIEVREERIKTNYLPLLLFFGGITALALNSHLGIGPGVIGLSVGVLSLIIGYKNCRKMMIDFDWNSLLFIMGIFVVVGATVAVGILQGFANFLGRLAMGSPFIALGILVWSSVGMSSFIDNVPYTVLMIPVCRELAGAMGSGYLFPFIYGTLIGTGIGGNITPVGATANVFACGMLEKRGCRVRLKEYLRLSLPPTLTSVALAHLLLLLTWM